MRDKQRSSRIRIGSVLRNISDEVIKSGMTERDGCVFLPIERRSGEPQPSWSHERLPDDPPPGFLDVAPNLVVEVVSPNDRWQDIREKIEEYFAIGVDRVWVVVPATRGVLVYESSTSLRQLREGVVLEGEGVLEGFKLPVARLFASRRDEK